MSLRWYITHLPTRRSKSFCEDGGGFLLVGLNSDNSVKQLKGNDRPINTQNARAEVLDAIKYVDGIYIFDSIRCTEFIELAKPDIYVKASDYSIDTLNIEERLALEEIGSIIVFTNYIDGYSTTKTIEKIKSK